MIPSVVANEVKQSVVEFLATTFALSDDDVRQSLQDFLRDDVDGIFRGPYLRVRTKFRAAPPSWKSPLGWMPSWFTPHLHQAKAFDRLTSLNHTPEPTLVTTGTGSGKTEAFLLPVLDHCARMRAEGKQGVKALLLYPMNALASDQARRIAGYVSSDPALAGVTAGLYVGEDGTHSTMGVDHLIDLKNELLREPPDILLTNYKMLDFMLLRQRDQKLWQASEPGLLQYVVLDEFHTYDGAQGTDVAMLLRRLGSALGLAVPGRPLGDATPVATSATLGSGTSSSDHMREFAGRVFGCPFPPESVIGEDRLNAEEVVADVDYSLPFPEVAQVLAVNLNDPLWLGPLAELFVGDANLTVTELGAQLMRHSLTRGVLAGADRVATEWDDALEAVIARIPTWGKHAQTDRDGAHEALTRFLALLSVARLVDPVTGKEVPLFNIEVQLWVREVSRLLRSVSHIPRFRWLDSGDTVDPLDPTPDVELPSVYCRQCGRSGWLGQAADFGDRLVVEPARVYRAMTENASTVRALIRASDGEVGVVWLSPDDGQLSDDDRGQAIPVLATPGEDEAKRNECPSCGERDAIRPLGSRVASMAAVGISQLFGSDKVNVEERKLLAFTDSVQDASHRAAFFASRTHRFNLRGVMAQAVETANPNPLSLADVGSEILSAARANPNMAYALVPPDLLTDRQVATVWTATPDPQGRTRLEDRLTFEAALEVGLRSRLGRTLELTGTASAWVIAGHDPRLGNLAAEVHRKLPGQPTLQFDSKGTEYQMYVRGLLERLRLKGGILHSWLEPYVVEDGNPWRLWGGRVAGMPVFLPDQSRPSFFTTETSSEKFDSVWALSATPSWLVDWAMRTLHVPATEARALNAAVLEQLELNDHIRGVTTNKHNTVYALDTHMVGLAAVPHTAGAWQHLRCDACQYSWMPPADQVHLWHDTPCLRYRCTGHFQTLVDAEASYYRRLYLSGMRRVVTDEHTGMLGRADREALETDFKSGTRPDSPNVMVCTPTMELGIDIGDLSTVMLTSIPRSPASYIQRVGRAGRLTGNALVVSFLPTEPRALYYLTEPRNMLAGEVRPPNCYLDAIEILRRQYLAFVIDASARGKVNAPPMPLRMGLVVPKGLDQGGWMHAIVQASQFNATSLADEFVGLFGEAITDNTRNQIHEFAANGVADLVKTAFSRWEGRLSDLSNQRRRLKEAIDVIDALPIRTQDDDDTRSRLAGERAAVHRQIDGVRDEYVLGGLERLGLLPNYTLIGDTVQLDASLWRRDPDGAYESTLYEYHRGTAIAIQEFAPGNSFYVAGHKLLIDGLDIGGVGDDDEVLWRLCPQCGYGSPENARPDWAQCPRCKNIDIADIGARHRVVSLTKVSTIESEEASRVYDDTDERERERYETVYTVDIDPLDVITAHEHDTVTFGIELARTATLRTVNLGRQRHGQPGVFVAGGEYVASRFRTCAHCGVVDGARRRRPNEDVRHRGWCYTRSGAKKPEWRDLVLMHELRTEAVRMLMPVSTFESQERLASFKGALMLGLRLDFGGEPDHLAIVTSDYPGSGGPGRRRFLVIHDTVPGGTGYLGRLADINRLGGILQAARTAIARCECQNEGRLACHRCLLGGVAPREIALVSRSLALEVLDQLLDKWEFHPVASVADIDISQVEQSELERRFRQLLLDWGTNPFTKGSAQPIALPDGKTGIELRLRDGDQQVARWLVVEQKQAGGVHQTVPDFVFKRQDGAPLEVAAYLDGFKFHASAENNRLADDAAKRRSLRAKGVVVWNITWDDVNAFEKGLNNEVHTHVADRHLVTEAQRMQAQQALGRGEAFPDLDARWMQYNPVRLLIEFLRHPDERWPLLARAAVGGLITGNPALADAPRYQLDEVGGAVRASLGHQPAPVGKPDGVILGVPAHSLNGLPIDVFVDSRDEYADKILPRLLVAASVDDTVAGVSAEGHKDRWADWLQWANLLQFANGQYAEHFVAAVSEHSHLDLGNLMLVQGDESGSEVGEAVEADAEAELELITTPAVRAFVRRAIQQGAPVPVAGYDIDDDGDLPPVEVAWISAKVAVLVEAGTADVDSIRALGWTARNIDDWTLGELMEAIGSSR